MLFYVSGRSLQNLSLDNESSHRNNNSKSTRFSDQQQQNQHTSIDSKSPTVVHCSEYICEHFHSL